MPTDLSIPNSIISAYIAGQQQKLRREQTAKNNEMKQQQLDEQKRQHDILQQQFDQQLEFSRSKFKAQSALKQAEYDLALETARQQMAERMGGVAPIGEAPENIQEIDLGGKLGKIRTLNPRGQVAKAAPMMEFRSKLDVGSAVSKAQGIAEVTQPYKLEQQEMRDLSHAKVLKDMEEMRHANSVKLLELKNKLGRESIGYKLALQHKFQQDLVTAEGMDAVIENYKNGTLTLEDQTKGGMKQAQREVLNRTLAQEGFTALKDREQAEIKALTALKSQYQDIEDLNNAIKAGDWTLARVKQAAFTAKRGTIASALGGQKGAISERDVQAMDAYQQSLILDTKIPWNKAKANDLRVQQFKKDVLAKQNAILKRFKLPQQVALKNTYDLLDDDEDLGPAQKLGGK